MKCKKTQLKNEENNRWQEWQIQWRDKITKKNSTDILEVKTSHSKAQNTTENFNSRRELSEERIFDLEDKPLK